MDPFPMFPLGTTLLPGSGVPLQVFEPRYRRMVQDILASDGAPEFGQVLITRGREAGGGDVRSDVGTLARMTDIRAVDDGRYTFVAVGVARIRVVEWRPDDPYPRASIEQWPDEPRSVDAGPVGERVEEVTERVVHLLELAARVAGGEGGTPPDVRTGLASDASMAVYMLAAMAPIGPADRYNVLAAAGLDVRLRVLSAALDDAEAMLIFRLS
ncbi:MAG: LON peptidase substrate-binding domain-containing protein [Acidimicrobiia bacterium]|nr:LON peptidase substrate-binding domain-containing protein [Acidimicrobiia bacterium]